MYPSLNIVSYLLLNSSLVYLPLWVPQDLVSCHSEIQEHIGARGATFEGWSRSSPIALSLLVLVSFIRPWSCDRAWCMLMVYPLGLEHNRTQGSKLNTKDWWADDSLLLCHINFGCDVWCWKHERGQELRGSGETLGNQEVLQENGYMRERIECKKMKGSGDQQAGR